MNLRNALGNVGLGALTVVCLLGGCTGMNRVKDAAQSGDRSSRVRSVDDIIVELQRYESERLASKPPEELARLVALWDQLRPRVLDPAYICRLKAVTGSQYLLLIETDYGSEVPSEARVRVSVLEFVPDGGYSYTISSFSAGWRLGITGFETHRDVQGIGDVLVILVGESKLRELYAIDGQKLVLIRCEAPNGKFGGLRNHYDNCVGNFLIGPWPQVTSEQECRRVLEKGSNVEILSVLTWLSGASFASTQHDEVTRTRRWALETKCLERLAANTDPWIREAAAACLQIVRKDLASINRSIGSDLDN